MRFKDHFSRQSAAYAKARPKYPGKLFNYLSSLTAKHDLAWDCGTGSGQAAVGLSPYFKEIVATDASASQIAHAEKKENITYRVGPAENSGLKDRSADLITVAQALHWFDFKNFYSEVERIAREKAIIAAWTYGLFSVNTEIDSVIYRYYNEITGAYWPAERRYIEERYETIPFPFNRIDPPGFTIEATYSLEDLHQYLLTWSASQRYIQDKGADPFMLIAADLEKIWHGEKKVYWPIYLLVGRI